MSGSGRICWWCRVDCLVHTHVWTGSPSQTTKSKKFSSLFPLPNGIACCLLQLNCGLIQHPADWFLSLHSLPLSSGRLDYIFTTPWRTWFYHNSDSCCWLSACRDSSSSFSFSFLFGILSLSIFSWLFTEGEFRNVSQGLRELRAQVAGPVSSQRFVRAQESLHGNTTWLSKLNFFIKSFTGSDFTFVSLFYFVFILVRLSIAFSPSVEWYVQ